MAIRDNILTLKNKEGTLTGNKVCNFAYDDTAYNDDTTAGANGVTTYNYNNHNNIPVKDPTVLKTNTTIISKGFRSQVSVLPRMLLNHIFGRVSYNLNKTVDTFNALLTNLYTYIGQPNGLATLDNTGRLPYSQLPLSAVEYKGAWNANTNTPHLASGTGTFGDEYIVSTQGTQNLGEGSITYKVGDRVIYNGSIWQRIPASSVRTVNSKTPDVNGNVTVNASDMVTPDVYGYDRTDMGEVWNVAIPSTQYGFANNVWNVNGLLFLCTANGVYWSDDETTWTQCVGINLRITSIYYFNGLYLGTGTGIFWSEDGKNWSRINYTPSSLAEDIFATYTNTIVYENGIFICTVNGGVYCRSTDGKNWTGIMTYVITGGSHIASGNGVFVGRESDGYMEWSADGLTWTACTIGTTGTWRTPSGGFVFANGIFVLSTYNGSGTETRLYWSEDGKTWYQGTYTTLSGESLSGVSYVNNLWIVGSNKAPLWSEDGKTWTRGTRDDTYTNNICAKVQYAKGIYVGYKSNIMCSHNGKDWFVPTSNTRYFNNVAYYKTRWFGVDTSDGNVYTSIGSLTNNVAQILDWLLFAVDNLLD